MRHRIGNVGQVTAALAVRLGLNSPDTQLEGATYVRRLESIQPNGIVANQHVWFRVEEDLVNVYRQYEEVSQGHQPIVFSDSSDHVSLYLGEDGINMTRRSKRGTSRLAETRSGELELVITRMQPGPDKIISDSVALDLLTMAAQMPCIIGDAGIQSGLDCFKWTPMGS